MLKHDRDALICDFAETYHIHDFKRLPAQTVAVLAVGLRDDSRIKMSMSGAKAPADILLLASAVDRLSLLVWMRTKDAEKGRNRPKSVLDGLFQKENQTVTYSSGEDFEKERQRLLNGA